MASGGLESALAEGRERHGPRIRLSIMMFLQFFIWGAWFELNFGYVPSLGFDAFSQQLVFATFPVSALVAMFFSTQFVDRNFAAEKFLAFSQLVGGVAMLLLTWTTDFWPFFLLMSVHCLFYVPTISITNSIAFANLKDPQRDFGLIRVWGTIGWIVASWPFIFILVDWAEVPEFGSVPFTEWLGQALGNSKKDAAFREASRYIYLVGGIASLVMAGFSLTLPHTPPKPAVAGAERFAWFEAMKLLKLPFVLVLFIVTFLDAAVHQTFFFWTERYLTGAIGIPGNWAIPVMKIGQVAEIVTMVFLGYVLKRLGWRMTMVLGVLGHAARFAVFAYYPEPWAAISINVLHGICYAFFFATVYIFVDEFFPKDARSSAQGLFNFLILGLGILAPNLLWPWLGKFYEIGKTEAGQPIYDFQGIFLYPLVTALVAALLLLVFFHPPARAAGRVPEEAEPPAEAELPP
jgi:nucleoside transporter